MSQDKKESDVEKLLSEIKKDVRKMKHAHPARYRENVDYYQRQAALQ